MINNQISNNKKYDLEERTLNFGKQVIQLANLLPKNQVNLKLVDQFVRSGTSIGANYREANDSLGQKDFYMRVRIARKEAKETLYWLELILENNNDFQEKIGSLVDECGQLVRILSSIIKQQIG